MYNNDSGGSESVMSPIKIEPAYNINIYIAGDVQRIKNLCSRYCMNVGFCVTVTQTDFVYTGGVESGAIVGVVSYPRFPDSSANLRKKAIDLANLLIVKTYQWSALVVTSEESIWITVRDGE